MTATTHHLVDLPHDCQPDTWHLYDDGDAEPACSLCGHTYTPHTADILIHAVTMLVGDTATTWRDPMMTGTLVAAANINAKPLTATDLIARAGINPRSTLAAELKAAIKADDSHRLVQITLPNHRPAHLLVVDGAAHCGAPVVLDQPYHPGDTLHLVATLDDIAAGDPTPGTVRCWAAPGHGHQIPAALDITIAAGVPADRTLTARLDQIQRDGGSVIHLSADGTPTIDCPWQTDTTTTTKLLDLGGVTYHIDPGTHQVLRCTPGRGNRPDVTDTVQQWTARGVANVYIDDDPDRVAAEGPDKHGARRPTPTVIELRRLDPLDPTRTITQEVIVPADRLDAPPHTWDGVRTPTYWTVPATKDAGERLAVQRALLAGDRTDVPPLTQRYLWRTIGWIPTPDGWAYLTPAGVITPAGVTAPAPVDPNWEPPPRVGGWRWHLDLDLPARDVLDDMDTHLAILSPAARAFVAMSIGRAHLHDTAPRGAILLNGATGGVGGGGGKSSLAALMACGLHAGRIDANSAGHELMLSTLPYLRDLGTTNRQTLLSYDDPRKGSSAQENAARADMILKLLAAAYAQSAGGRKTGVDPVTGERYGVTQPWVAAAIFTGEYPPATDAGNASRWWDVPIDRHAHPVFAAGVTDPAVKGMWRWIRRGGLARATAAYVRWLAANHDRVAAEQDTLRDDLIGDLQAVAGNRASEIAGDWLTGVVWWARFVADVRGAGEAAAREMVAAMIGAIRAHGALDAADQHELKSHPRQLLETLAAGLRAGIWCARGAGTVDDARLVGWSVDPPTDYRMSFEVGDRPAKPNALEIGVVQQIDGMWVLRTQESALCLDKQRWNKSDAVELIRNLPSLYVEMGVPAPAPMDEMRRFGGTKRGKTLPISLDLLRSVAPATVEEIKAAALTAIFGADEF